MKSEIWGCGVSLAGLCSLLLISAGDEQLQAALDAVNNTPVEHSDQTGVDSRYGQRAEEANSWNRHWGSGYLGPVV